MKSPTGQYSYRQAVITFPTRRRVGDVFTRPVIEVLRQARNLKQRSQITNSQAVRTNRQAGIHITLDKPPSPVICHLFHTTKMTGTHKEQLIDHLRVFLVFIEFNFLFYMIFSRHRRQHRQTNMSPNKIHKHMSGNGLTN